MTNLEATCTRCDRPARGNVPATDAHPAHYCRQCAEHCEMAAYLRERPNGWADFHAAALPPQVHTIDVQTANGWVRLEVTNDQALQLVRDLGDALGFNPGLAPR